MVVVNVEDDGRIIVTGSSGFQATISAEDAELLIKQLPENITKSRAAIQEQKKLKIAALRKELATLEKDIR